MTERTTVPEAAFLEAVEQMALRRQRRDRWSSRAVFWAAVRFGVDELRAEAWPAAADRWTRLLAVAEREHLPPPPGVPEAECLPTDATTANQALARMRGIVGRGR